MDATSPARSLFPASLSITLPPASPALCTPPGDLHHLGTSTASLANSPASIKTGLTPQKAPDSARCPTGARTGRQWGAKPGWRCARRKAGAQGHRLSWDTAPPTRPTSCPENLRLQWRQILVNASHARGLTLSRRIWPSHPLSVGQCWGPRGDAGTTPRVQSGAASHRAAGTAWAPCHSERCTKLPPSTRKPRGEPQGGRGDLSPLSMMPSVINSHSHHWL